MSKVILVSGWRLTWRPSSAEIESKVVVEVSSFTFCVELDVSSNYDWTSGCHIERTHQ